MEQSPTFSLMKETNQVLTHRRLWGEKRRWVDGECEKERGKDNEEEMRHYVPVMLLYVVCSLVLCICQHGQK